MRVLILDPFHGAAGDMVTGALLDCGADSEIVMRAMKAVVAEPSITQVTGPGSGAQGRYKSNTATGRWTMC